VLREIDRVIHQLDVPPLQVEIEAVIMSVEHDKDQEFSINFSVVDNARRVLGTFGNGALINAAAGFDPARTVNPDGSLRAGSAANEDGAKFAYTGNSLTYFIRALETTGKVEVLARPRLLVLNKQQANLLLGQQLGYSTLSQNLVSTTQQIQFLNVGTQLRVRPFISSDGLIRMEVHPERSTGVLNAQNIPQTTIAEVTTNVMVPDGATLVIGGLVDQVDNRTQNATPFLGDLPVVGVLFRNRIRMGSRRELVVLLTPRIWNPNGPPATPYLPPPAFIPADAGKIYPVTTNLPDLDPLARPLAAPVRVTPAAPPVPGPTIPSPSTPTSNIPAQGTAPRSTPDSSVPALSLPAPTLPVPGDASPQGTAPPAPGQGTTPPGIPTPGSAEASAPWLEVEVTLPSKSVPIRTSSIYEIHVRNRTDQPARGVVLGAICTPGLEMTEADGPTAGYQSTGQNMVYGALEQVPPRAEIVFRIKALAAREGTQTFRAVLRSQDLPREVSGEAQVQVGPPTK
jgi:hypothetical protein